MKVIIAGSREITNPALLVGIMDEQKDVTEVVSGGAPGVDKLGEGWAMDHGVPIKTFYPDWENHGKAAGPIRNQAMAKYADKLIAIWDGKSAGTRHMIDEMYKLGKPVRIKEVNG